MPTSCRLSVFPGRRPTCILATYLAVLCVGADLATVEPAVQAPSFFSELKPVWQTELQGAAAYPPIFSTSHVTVLLHSNELVVISLDEGKLLWRKEAKAIVAPAASESLAFTDSGRSVMALALGDGRERWRLDLTADVTHLFADAGWLFVGTSANELTAVDAASGKPVWYRAVGASLSAAPIPAGDRVYVPLADGRLAALSLASGELRWEVKLGDAATGILALDDRLFVGSRDNFFYCLRADDGDRKWRWPTGADIVGTAVIDAKLVFFISRDNVLRALDRSKGHQRWKRSLIERPIDGPQLIDGHLIVGSGTMAGRYTYNVDLKDRKKAVLIPPLRAYTAATGEPAGEFQSPGELAGAPLLRSQAGSLRLVVVTRDGKVHGYLAISKSVIESRPKPL